MRYLLDTHIWLWWMQDSPKLSREARRLISNKQHTIYVSAVSLWEVRIKQQIGKITLSDNFLEGVANIGFTQLPIVFEHINNLLHFPLHHYDPFDRLLIAQAHCENLIILTYDKAFKQYQAPMILFQN